MNKKIILFFGAAGAGKAYCKHTNSLPTFFIDNDSAKWETKIIDTEIKSPEYIKKNLNNIEKVVITSGYVKAILPQLLDYGVPREIIEIPPKSFLGEHPFKIITNKIESAKFLHDLMTKNKNSFVVAVGGTALGFSRDKDFIEWDFDIDLFASLKNKSQLFEFLELINCEPFIEDQSIKGDFKLSNGDMVPFAIDFFNPDLEEYTDIYEDHIWKWPTKMFTEYSVVDIHGFLLNVPNPVEKYLEGIYGKSWRTPNSNFNYEDYGN